MSSFRISIIGSGGLRIEDPPIYWVSFCFLIVFLICMLSLMGAVYARYSPSERQVSWEGNTRKVKELGQGWKGLVVRILLSFATGFAVWGSLQSSSVTLDRDSGTYIVNSGRVFFVQDVSAGKLDDIAYATLESDGPAKRFVLVLQSGERLSLGAYTTQSMQSEGVAAVNRFLKLSQPGEPVNE